VEGGPNVVSRLHAEGLVDRYVFHLAPALMGDGAGSFSSVHTPTIADMWRGRTLGVRQLGDDVEIVVAAERTTV
jgi:diaminohydroxyphosphoribosylaminopyrimidine deaminase/5-amino-6-(5-phosphoribosylamino)uracil reductase